MTSPYGFEVQENCSKCAWRESSFFCNVSGRAMLRLQDIASVEVHPAGKVLYAEGQAAKGIYILCNGRAKLSTASKHGNIIILKIARPGEALGVGAVLAHRAHDETAELLNSCQVKFIPKRELESYLSKHTQAALKAALQLDQDRVSTRDQIRQLGFSIFGTRKLAQLLIRWSRESGANSASERAFQVPYTHEEIAQMIGSTRETVTRVLNKFRQEKTVEIYSGTFVVRDIKRLLEFAGD